MAEFVAKTTAGDVRGVEIAEGVVFKGIPYVAPPKGERRYLPPAPHAPWDGVRDCSEFGPVCPQTQFGEMAGVMANMSSTETTDEDCLFLNVWTPALDDRRRATMVWVHGGAFSSGSGSQPVFDGSAFARDDVVVVTLNYRLNAFGFLFLDDLFDGAEGTGNLGLLDQIAALEWVRDNIAQFGGDPDNVTLFGESAGGMSVATLMAAPAARGLFRRGIAQSGAGHNGHSREAATAIARRVLELVEVQPGDWDALRSVAPERLVETSTAVARGEAAGILGTEFEQLPFQPVIDDVVLHGVPIERVRAGSSADVDLIVGVCTEEWRMMLFGAPEPVWQFIPDPDISPFFTDSRHDVESVLELYGKARPGQSERELRAAVVTDRVFCAPARRFAEAQHEHHEQVWMYRFTWRSPANGGMVGAGHMVDLPFVFDTLHVAPDLVGPDRPSEVAASIHGAWVRFAKTGDPNGGDLPAWPTYDDDVRPVMDFGLEQELVHDPDAAERQLWDELL